MPVEPVEAERLPGRLQATFWPGDPVASAGHLALWGLPDDHLDDAVAHLGFPAGHHAALRTVLPRTARARTRVSAATVPARLVPVLPATATLVALPPGEEWPGWQRPSDSVLVWGMAAKLACELVMAGRMVPQLRVAGDVGVAGWVCAPGGDGRLSQLVASMPPAAHALITDEDEGTVWHPDALLRAYLDAVADACARAGGTPRPAPKHFAGAWARALRAIDPVVQLPAGREATAAELAEWAAPLLGGGSHAGGRLCLRLQLPDAGVLDVDASRVTAADEGDAVAAAAVEIGGAGDEGNIRGNGDAGAWRVDLLLQAADDPSLFLPAGQVWSHAGDRLPMGRREVADAQEALVRGLAQACRLFAPLQPCLDDRAPDGLDLDARSAGALIEAAGTLTAAGIGVLLPAELTAGGQRRLRARLRARSATTTPGSERPAGLGADQLASFAWEAALGDDPIDPDEFARIVALKQPLVRWRGRWVRVDPDEAATLADLVGREEPATVVGVLAATLAGSHTVDGLGDVEVVADGGLAEVVTRLRDGRDRAPRLDGVRATLRHYQAHGVAWLQTLADMGLGGVLADDMGLGKTLQSIALLASRSGDRPHLVVCPVSVVGNWERELARFAPGLPVVRHHGPDRPATPEQLPAGAVVVTSYGLLRLDADLLGQVEWDVVVLDEAQQLKNHRTKVARAARTLDARMRLALTGTPVENRLAELWAILDLTTPGLLGGFTSFRRHYAAPIERWQDPDATRRLRLLTGPFVLRRVKTDPDIAPELPGKTELTASCRLTREQATLYQAAVDDAFAADLGAGIERRGRILKLLTELKQICNHPAQYLGERGPLRSRSGKLDRAVELLAEIVAAGDRALVFTQYRRMGELLVAHLATALDLPEVPFLHGGVTRSGRESMVEAFQHDPDAPPVLLLSLKAAGTGLNLTAATHVLHYDRWWNPAVEDQATDRAYRIGQHRAVMVHKLVTVGTLEERIARLIDDKRALADAVLGDGESWLTELDDDTLRDLVRLRPDDLDGAESGDDDGFDGAVDVDVEAAS